MYLQNLVIQNASVIGQQVEDQFVVDLDVRKLDCKLPLFIFVLQLSDFVK